MRHHPVRCIVSGRQALCELPGDALRVEQIVGGDAKPTHLAVETGDLRGHRQVQQSEVLIQFSASIENRQQFQRFESCRLRPQRPLPLRYNEGQTLARPHIQSLGDTAPENQPIATTAKDAYRVFAQIGKDSGRLIITVCCNADAARGFDVGAAHQECVKFHKGRRLAHLGVYAQFFQVSLPVACGNSGIHGYVRHER